MNERYGAYWVSRDEVRLGKDVGYFLGPWRITTLTGKDGFFSSGSLRCWKEAAAIARENQYQIIYSETTDIAGTATVVCHFYSLSPEAEIWRVRTEMDSLVKRLKGR